MKFTTPCFVRVEDAEERKKLTEWMDSKIGVKPLASHNDECCYLVMMSQSCMWICMETEFTIKHCEKDGYNCGSNIELFKALAAMSDENDYMQLFINKNNKYRWVLCNTQRLFDAVAKECDWRKATAEEIIKHFKKSLNRV